MTAVSKLGHDIAQAVVATQAERNDLAQRVEIAEKFACTAQAMLAQGKPGGAIGRQLTAIRNVLNNRVEDAPLLPEHLASAKLKLTLGDEGIDPIAAALWQFLDDIDTLDDACRDHALLYRKRARAIAAKRLKYLISYDGMTLVHAPAVLAHEPKPRKRACRKKTK